VLLGAATSLLHHAGRWARVGVAWHDAAWRPFPRPCCLTCGPTSGGHACMQAQHTHAHTHAPPPPPPCRRPRALRRGRGLPARLSCRLPACSTHPRRPADPAPAGLWTWGHQPWRSWSARSSA
jgi:hypothetical protein